MKSHSMSLPPQKSPCVDGKNILVLVSHVFDDRSTLGISWDPANQVLQITFVSNEEDRACSAQNALAALKQVPRYPGTHSVTKICSWLLWKLIPQNNGKSSSNETHRYWPMPKWQFLATLKRFSDFLHAPARSSLHLQVPNPCLADHHLFSGTKGTQNVSGISPREEKQRTVQLSTWPKILSIDLFIVSLYAASGDPDCHHQHPSTSGMGVAPWIKNCLSENQVLQNLIVDHHFPYEIAINWDIPHFLTKRHASSCKMST